MSDQAAWRVFRQMQASVLAAGLLMYAAASLDAWQVLTGGAAAKLRLIAVFPGVYLVATLAASLALPALRRAVRRHLLLSFRTGFGQTLISVVVGLGLLILIAGLVVWQVHHVATGGSSPAGAFSGYGAGLGLLIAQVILLRRMSPGDDPGA